MPIAINYKICDNFSECPCIAACPCDVIYYDEIKGKLVADNSKCKSCGKCVGACEIGAISLAKTDEELTTILKEIEDDPRKASDLFVDRYGAQPILETFLIEEINLEKRLDNTNKLVVVELFDENSIQCLLHSIPIKDLFDIEDYEYYRVEIKNSDLTSKYSVKNLPSLLFFKKGNLFDKIEGYYADTQVNEFKQKIKTIVKER